METKRILRVQQDFTSKQYSCDRRARKKEYWLKQLRLKWIIRFIINGHEIWVMASTGLCEKYKI
jgi:hypothetical protein